MTNSSTYGIDGSKASRLLQKIYGRSDVFSSTRVIDFMSEQLKKVCANHMRLRSSD